MASVTKEDYIQALKNRLSANEIINVFIKQREENHKKIPKGGCPQCGVTRSVSNFEKTWCPDCGYVHCEKNGLFVHENG